MATRFTTGFPWEILVISNCTFRASLTLIFCHGHIPVGTNRAGLAIRCVEQKCTTWTHVAFVYVVMFAKGSTGTAIADAVRSSSTIASHPCAFVAV